MSGFILHCIPDGRLDKSNDVGDYINHLLVTLPQTNCLQYAVACNNYFTVKKAMQLAWNHGISFLGAACHHRGWPPKEIGSITDDRFNTWYRLKHEDNYMVYRWIDNNVVTMVSNMHTGDESIICQRRKPRMTQTNQ